MLQVVLYWNQEMLTGVHVNSTVSPEQHTQVFNQLSLHNYSHSPFFSDITNKNIVRNKHPLVEFINTKSLNQHYNSIF